MLHSIEPEADEEADNMDPQAMGKERAKHLHARYHSFLKGDFDQLLKVDHGNRTPKEKEKEKDPKD